MYQKLQIWGFWVESRDSITGRRTVRQFKRLNQGNVGQQAECESKRESEREKLAIANKINLEDFQRFCSSQEVITSQCIGGAFMFPFFFCCCFRTIVQPSSMCIQPYEMHIGGNHVDWRHLPPAKTSAHPSPLQGMFITSICYSQRVIHHESLAPDRTPALPSSILTSTCKTLIDVSSS